MPHGRLIFASLAAWLAVSASAKAAESTYPFEGSWVRSDRQCSTSAARERTYTGREVISPRGRCTIRKIATGSNTTFEVFERCDRPGERPSNISETIRMTGADSLVLNRSTQRLKLSRSLRFTRCPTPAPLTSGPKPAVPPAVPKTAPKPAH